MDANYFRLLAISTQAQDNKTPPALPGGEHPHPQFSRPDADVTDTGGDSADHVSEGSFNQGYYQRFFNEGPKLGKGLRGSVFRCQVRLPPPEAPRPVNPALRAASEFTRLIHRRDNHTWLARMLKEVHLLGQFHHNNIIDYKHAWLEHHKLTNFGMHDPARFGESFGGERELRRPQSAKDYAIHEKERRRRRRLPFWDSGLRDPEPSPSAAGRLNESGGRLLSIDHILSFFIDIAEGLSHLHRHGIIHRDLKPPNLLLNFKDTSDPDEMHVLALPPVPDFRTGFARTTLTSVHFRLRSPTVLLSDFGECEVLAQLTNRHRTGATGTLEFIAPELVKGPAELRFPRLGELQGKYLPEYSHKADMWSLGILLYYLCFSKLPYQQTDDVDALKEEILHAFHPPLTTLFACSRRVDFPDENEREPGLAPRVLQELKDLITVLLKPDAASRPS
ncbi:MAG: kinase-like domain-containing protein, partial [Olpidium bornovanus]